MRKITTEIMEYGYAFLYERYRLPLYVTECGLSCNDHIFLDGKELSPGLDGLGYRSGCRRVAV